jgi:presequence protease
VSKLDFNKLNAYELIEERHLDDLGAEGYLLKHKKSGARLFLVSNEDNNKVFSIGFRTPPINSCGLTHILEHSVLCGSREFPAKDPFVELAKGSLNTFLNAMTYPDKTVYPIASCNDKDFQNLMHVYLDAVFYPNIYKREEIFRQEGWHYELEEAEGDLSINGVVYNEMKGAFSSPEGVLEREILNSLFPDTPYGFESGGDPDVIPELSYETFLDFHRQYYHPANSYIFLYGDMDMEEKLLWMDEHYLKDFEEIEIDTEVKVQEPFAKQITVCKDYSVTEEDTLDHNTYLSENFVVGSTLDSKLYTAIEVLEYALITAPGAPLKQALLDAGIGQDIMSSVDNGILQPVFSIIAKNANEEDQDKFLSVVRETLEELADKGLDKKTLLAGINSFEFRYREADFGRFPIGLSYGLQCMDSWLYDEKDPFMHLEENKTFAFLKEAAEGNYFEELIRKYFLNNSHSSLVICRPKRGLTAENDKKLSEKLAAYKASLSKEEVEELVAQTKHLKEYQSEPSTKEELESIPLLALDDIKKEAEPFQNRMIKAGNTPLLMHDLETNRIAYLSFVFDAEHILEEELPYLGILSSVLGYVDTEHYSFRELSNEINIHTGGIDSRVSVFTDNRESMDTHVKFIVSAKSLFEEVGKTFELTKEVLFASKLEDDKRLKEIISQLKSRVQMTMNSSGHAVASMRGMSYFSESAVAIDAGSGVAFYRVLEELSADFDQKKEELRAKLSELCKKILCKEHLLVSVTAGEGLEEQLLAEVKEFEEKLYDAPEAEKAVYACEKKNEGFKTASKVNYVARCGNFKSHGFDYVGTLKILKVIMSYDYMWNRIRVLGGAYGCMSGFDRNGDSYFVSYRDPHMSRTEDVYEGIPQYLREFNVDDRDMLKFIIGTISMMDTPLNPSAKGSRNMSAYLSGLTLEQLQKERDEVLSAGKEDIQALAPYVEAILSDDCRCVIGDESKITENKDRFGRLESLQ